MDNFNSVSLGFAGGIATIFVVAVLAFAIAKQNVEDLAREIAEADVMSKILPAPSTPLHFLSLLNKARNLREQCLSNLRSGRLLAAIACAKLGRQAAKDARVVIDTKLAEVVRENEQETEAAKEAENG